MQTKRAVPYEQIADFIIETRCTIRQAGKHFGISRMCVYRAVQILKDEDRERYIKARDIIEWNKYQRHIRGGADTFAI